MSKWLASASLRDELGRAIEQALARSQEGVPTPPPDARIDKPLLAAAGVRSWTTFMKLSKHVSVVSDGSLLKVTPIAIWVAKRALSRSRI
jgi:hypothetical protein